MPKLTLLHAGTPRGTLVVADAALQRFALLRQYADVDSAPVDLSPLIAPDVFEGLASLLQRLADGVPVDSVIAAATVATEGAAVDAEVEAARYFGLDPPPPPALRDPGCVGGDDEATWVERAYDPYKAVRDAHAAHGRAVQWTLGFGITHHVTNLQTTTPSGMLTTHIRFQVASGGRNEWVAELPVTDGRAALVWSAWCIGAPPPATLTLETDAVRVALAGDTLAVFTHLAAPFELPHGKRPAAAALLLPLMERSIVRRLVVRAQWPRTLTGAPTLQVQRFVTSADEARRLAAADELRVSRRDAVTRPGDIHARYAFSVETVDVHRAGAQDIAVPLRASTAVVAIAFQVVTAAGNPIPHAVRAASIPAIDQAVDFTLEASADGTAKGEWAVLCYASGLGRTGALDGAITFPDRAVAYVTLEAPAGSTLRIHTIAEHPRLLNAYAAPIYASVLEATVPRRAPRYQPPWREDADGGCLERTDAAVHEYLTHIAGLPRPGRNAAAGAADGALPEAPAAE